VRPLALRYGPHRANVADLWLPAERPAAHQSPAPVVVLVHGGYWRAHFTKIVMTPLALDARRRGWAVLNVEYRRLGRLGGCGRWPATFTDVATAIDHLATVDRALIDLGRVVLIGHTAGGLLALWAAGRPADTAVVPAVGVVALAPVTDLRRAATGSSEVRIASSTRCAPVGCRTSC
jgi:acetyl esterase/lipase